MKVVIYGPTAVGKSDVAVCLAKKIDAEIISVDSMQVYKKLDVGTAKITNEEMCGVPHHLLSFLELNQKFSVFDFVTLAKQKIAEIESRGKNVILCGGTGLYIKALIENYDLQKDENYENDIKIFNEKSIQELIDFLYDKNITLTDSDKNNKFRLVRYAVNAKNNIVATKSQNVDYKVFCLNSPREVLYQRINTRVDKMFDCGLEDECRMLLKQDDVAEIGCLKAIGYKEILPFLKRECSKNECIELLKKNTRNYAKRQITFFNQFENKQIIIVETKKQAVEDIMNCLNNAQ